MNARVATTEADAGRPAAPAIDPLERLALARWRFAALLTGGVLVAYFGFIGLVAFDKEAMGAELTDGLSVGIVLGALVILVAWALTFAYVSWANGRYDREVAILRADRRAP